MHMHITHILSVAAFAVTAALSASCSRHYDLPKRLTSIDSIIETAPQTAEARIAAIADSMTDAPMPERMYLDLLRLKAMSFAYKEYTSDSIAARLVSYYEDEGDERMLPEVYYYAGKVYKSLRDNPQAIDYFQQAADLLPDKPTQLKSRIYSQLGDIFWHQLMAGKALNMFKQGYINDKQLKDTTGMIYSLRDIGSIYRSYDKPNAALRFYKKALTLAREQGNKDMEATVCGQMAKLYIACSDFNTAKKYLKIATDYDDPYDRNSILYVKASLFRMTGNTDSAILCYQRLIQEDNIYTRRMAYKMLAEYSMARNDVDKTLLYLKQFESTTDSILQITSADAIAQADASYNYKLREKENARLKAEKTDMRNLIIIILSVSVIMIILLSAFVIHSRQRRVLLRYKLEKYKALMLRENEKTPEIDKNDKDISDYEIYKVILQIVNNPSSKKRILSKDEWSLLRDAVNEVSPDFDKKLSELCKMSEKDYHLCLLLKTGIPLSDIKEIVALSSSGVNSARNKLYIRAFGEKKHPEEWDKIIRSL